MWQFLSYNISENLTAYKNGKRIKIINERRIAKGDSCNLTSLELPTHLGTHIDFLYHFDENGKKGDDLQANEFVFKATQLVDISNNLKNDKIITEQNFDELNFNSNTDLLIIKTGYCKERFNEKYYKNYPGFSEKLAKYFKSKMPKLRAIGFDLISLSSPLNGELGKKAHIEFLKEEKILIIEDMDLRNLDSDSQINTVVVAPLRFENSDGAPVTVLYN